MRTPVLPDLFIENVPMAYIARGIHVDPRERDTILIQIVDPGMTQPVPKYERLFCEIHQFWFYDLERLNEPGLITVDEASRIAGIVGRALVERKNVVVHCVAGVCRSGAVVELGVALGFAEVEGRGRQPNTTIKNLLFKCAGIGFDPNNSPFSN